MKNKLTLFLLSLAAQQLAAQSLELNQQGYFNCEGVDVMAFDDFYPEIFSADPVYNALNFILGCHPGTNQASFASGVGAQSATVGYGLNRADWSYIPGGVVSGTALIRPDFPELLTFPFLWQQVEYVLGGGSSHYMFLVLAAQQLSKEA